VRLLHWALVAVVAAAWWTGSTSATHEWLGYAAGAIVATRLAWGWAGGRYARFAQFVRRPADTLAYGRAVLARRAPRYLGHNPLGGWMVLALLTVLAALVITGALYMTDWLWGYGWLAALHEGLGWLLLGLVSLHVGGALVTGRAHGENLVRAMVTGRKRAPGAGDVDG